MRCKIGDLAVIVLPGNRSGYRNVGKIVEVVSYLGDMPADTSFRGPDGRMKRAGDAGPLWWVRAVGTPLVVPTGMAVMYLPEGHISDYRLRPIRDGEGDDETLQWAPVPKESVK